MLRNSDRIEFGVRDSYQLTFSVGTAGDSAACWSRFLVRPRGRRAAARNNLVKLRSLVEVARALQNSLSTSEVLTAVVDAALAVTGCERGFLLLRRRATGADLEVSVARDTPGGRSSRTICEFPRH